MIRDFTVATEFGARSKPLRELEELLAPYVARWRGYGQKIGEDHQRRPHWLRLVCREDSI